MMHEFDAFKPNDIVICINSTDMNFYITQGKAYCVIRYHKGYVSEDAVEILGDTGERELCFAHRFISTEGLTAVEKAVYGV